MLKVNTCYGKLDSELLTRLSCVKLVAFDVDGTLTDGGIYYDNQNNEIKKFNVKDGFGVVALVNEGLECAVITGRDAPLTERRMQDLKVQHIIQGERDKGTALEKLCEQLKISPDETVCFGDDINDMPMFRKTGVVVCPHDAHPFVKNHADYVTTLNGGCGAMRELCDLILMAKGIMTPDGGFVDERY